MAKDDAGRIVVGVSGEGNSLHVVKLRRSKDKVQLLEAKSYTLKQSLDTQDTGEEIVETLEDENGAADGAGSIDITAEAPEDEMAMMGFEPEEESREDAGVFVEVLQMAQDKKSRLAISVAEPQIFYNVFDSDWNLKGHKLMKRVIAELATHKPEYRALKEDAIGLIHLTENRLMGVVRERNLILLDEMEKVKSFIGNRLPTIAFIESLEVSLANLVVSRYDLAEEEITLILYVGSDNSRFTFLKGRDIHHISPNIADGANSPTIASTLSSRLLFELDNLDLAQVDNIVLAGFAPAAGLGEFLADNFPSEVHIEALTMHDMDLKKVENGEPLDLAPYAPAIGAALRVIHPERESLYRVDITPTRIKESQNRLMMSTPGWILLVLIPFIVGFSIWHAQQLETQVRELRNTAIPLQVQLDEHKNLENSIASAESTLSNFEKSFSVIDSLNVGTDRWSLFLGKLMKLSRSVDDIWFTDISSGDNNTVRLTGYSLYRNRIPRLIDDLGKATLSKVEVQEIREKTVYRFEIEATVPDK